MRVQIFLFRPVALSSRQIVFLPDHLPIQTQQWFAVAAGVDLRGIFNCWTLTGDRGQIQCMPATAYAYKCIFQSTFMLNWVPKVYKYRFGNFSAIWRTDATSLDKTTNCHHICSCYKILHTIHFFLSLTQVKGHSTKTTRILKKQIKLLIRGNLHLLILDTHE